MTINNPSPAATALGFPGSASSLYSGGSIADQLSNETEEQRKKRLAQIQASQGGASFLTAGYSGAVSAAGSALGLT
jgi:hypothetical protein